MSLEEVLEGGGVLAQEVCGHLEEESQGGVVLLEFLEEGEFFPVVPGFRGVSPEGILDIHEEPGVLEESPCGGDGVHPASLRHLSGVLWGEEVAGAHQGEVGEELPGLGQPFPSPGDGAVGFLDCPEMEGEEIGLCGLEHGGQGLGELLGVLEARAHDGCRAHKL